MMSLERSLFWFLVSLVSERDRLDDGLLSDFCHLSMTSVMLFDVLDTKLLKFFVSGIPPLYLL
jgi:hypothetical protein